MARYSQRRYAFLSYVILCSFDVSVVRNNMASVSGGTESYYPPFVGTNYTEDFWPRKTAEYIDLYAVARTLSDKTATSPFNIINIIQMTFKIPDNEMTLIDNTSNIILDDNKVNTEMYNVMMDIRKIYKSPTKSDEIDKKMVLDLIKQMDVINKRNAKQIIKTKTISLKSKKLTN